MSIDRFFLTGSLGFWHVCSSVCMFVSHLADYFSVSIFVHKLTCLLLFWFVGKVVFWYMCQTMFVGLTSYSMSLFGLIEIDHQLFSWKKKTYCQDVVSVKMFISLLKDCLVAMSVVTKSVMLYIFLLFLYVAVHSHCCHSW